MRLKLVSRLINILASLFSVKTEMIKVLLKAAPNRNFFVPFSITIQQKIYLRSAPVYGYRFGSEFKKKKPYSYKYRIFAENK